MKKKIVLMAGLLVCFSASAFAASEKIYCGNGSASFALVVVDNTIKLFFDGQDQSSRYNMSKTTDGYQAIEINPSHNNPGPSIAFKSCGGGNTTSAQFIGGIVSNQPFPCTCKSE